MPEYPKLTFEEARAWWDDTIRNMQPRSQWSMIAAAEAAYNGFGGSVEIVLPHAGDRKADVHYVGYSPVRVKVPRPRE